MHQSSIGDLLGQAEINQNCQFLEMHQPGVSDLGTVEGKLPQVGQPLEMCAAQALRFSPSDRNRVGNNGGHRPEATKRPNARHNYEARGLKLTEEMRKPPNEPREGVIFTSK